MTTRLPNPAPSAPMRAYSLLTILLGISLSTHAAPGDVDLSFNPGSSINDRVEAVTRQSDGKWIIVGAFTAVQGAARGRVARLNADGSTDHTFMEGLTGANSWVHSVAVQSDGKIVIGGLFSMVNGTARAKIARLNADGTLDPTFGNALPGVDSLFAYVNAVAIQPDGKILIGGNFSSVNGMARNNIARLNTDGTLDSTFANGLAGPNIEVASIVLQADGKLLISGSFDSVNGIARGRVARLNANGSVDTSFGNGLAGADAVIFSVAVQPDGKIVIGGAFTSVNGAARTGIARLNTSGTLDTTFGNGLAGAYFVRSLALESEGTLVIGGQFTSVNGVARTNVARLSSDGSLAVWACIVCNPPVSADGVVWCVAVRDDGLVILGGDFRSVSGTPRNRLAAVDTDGGSVTPEFDNGQGGPNAWLNSLAVQTDGKVLVGGVFTAVDGQTRNRIARLNRDGSLDMGFGAGLSGANGDINTVALQGDGKIVIGGRFTSVNDTARTSLARLNADGTLDTAFTTVLAGLGGANAIVDSIAVQPDGKLLVGGSISAVNGEAHSRIARVNADGSLDRTFTSGLSTNSSIVNYIAVQADGKVLIGGRAAFVSLNGDTRGRVARLNIDGTLDATFGDGLSGVDFSCCRADIVLALLEQSDGKILVGGDFASVNGVPRSGLARLNADGSLDTAFGDGLDGLGIFYGIDRVRWFQEQSDGKILVGGFFASIHGVARGGIARLNADGTVDTTFGDGLAGANSSVRAAALQIDGKLTIGGEFTGVNGIAGSGVARLYTSFLPPSLALAFDGGMPAVQIRGEIGRQYVLEYVPQLPASSPWTALPTFTLTNSPQTVADPTATSVSQRFYRARLAP